ncbi:MAG: toxin-activating lysine-acyltransferase [Hyphomicrobiaceae bacterium]|nr:toxin-activating lysine-acyltransferase [Hyphomicrobiaceae bacterium]
MFGRFKGKAPDAPASAEPAANIQARSELSAAGTATTQPRQARADSKLPDEIKAKPEQEQAARRRAAIAVRHSLAFAQIVSVLMRSPLHQRYPIAALQWLVLPPLLTGQFSIGHADNKQQGTPVPVAVALWARVSAEVDKRLSENLDQPIQLRPREWRSGETLWLIEAVGDQRALPQFLKHLAETVFKGCEVKLRRRGADEKVVVTSLAALNASG